MPRMSKKRKEEWALFLNEHNRIEYNSLCKKCTGECKQSYRAEVIYCPDYHRKDYHKRDEKKQQRTETAGE